MGHSIVEFPQSQTILWKPEVPRDGSTALHDADRKVPADDRGRVHLNMNFGGPTGDKLSQLNRIAVSAHDGVLGLGFFYDDGSHFWYGSRHFTDSFSCRIPCCEMSFRINGRLGERITELQALTGGKHKTGLPVVLGFKVRRYSN